MLRYRLRSKIVGVHQEDTRQVAIYIPAGSVVTVHDEVVDVTGFLEVEWNGESVQVFAVDLRNRGELTSVRGA